MSSAETAPLDLAGAIDVIEETYEFMLAYAAQGRVNDTDQSDGGIRACLERSRNALGVIAAVKIPGDAAQAFMEVVRQDAIKAGAALGLVLARAIGPLLKPFPATLELRSIDGALRKREAVIVKENTGYGSEVL